MSVYGHLSFTGSVTCWKETKSELGLRATLLAKCLAMNAKLGEAIPSQPMLRLFQLRRVFSREQLGEFLGGVLPLDGDIVDAYFDRHPDRIGNLNPNRKIPTAAQVAAAAAAESEETDEREE